MTNPALVTRDDVIKSLSLLKIIKDPGDREAVIDGLIENVRDLAITIYDPTFEVAAIRSLAKIFGIPEKRIETLMKLPAEILYENNDPIKFEEALVEHVVLDSCGSIQVAAIEIALIGAGFHSLFRKLIIDQHPEIARIPNFEIQACTLEEFRELQRKGIIRGTKKPEPEPEPELDEEDAPAGYCAQGDEGWFGDGENRDVV